MRNCTDAERQLSASRSHERLADFGDGLRSAINQEMALSERRLASTTPASPDGTGVDSSAALRVTILCGRGADVAEPDIALDKLPRPQLGLAEAAAS